MHISTSHQECMKVLELVSRVSTKHATLPVLQCAVFEATEEGVFVRATNLEIGIEAKLPAKVISSGTVAVNAATLLQTVSLINQKEIELIVEDGALVVKTPTSRTSVIMQSSDEFPTLPMVEEEGFTVNGKNFAYGIKTAAFAASPASIKPEFGSVYVYQGKEHTLTFVSTDGFRLVEKTVPMQGVVFEKGILVPFKNALEIARVAELFDEDPEIRINENQCTLIFSHCMITTRLVAGQFPDYKQIIPKEYVTHATLLVGDLQTALKKTGIFLNKFMQLNMRVENGTLFLSSKGEVGMTEEEISIAKEGNDLSLNVNQRYVSEILGHITDDSIVVHFAGPGRSLVIEGVYDKSLRYLVMPMNR